MRTHTKKLGKIAPGVPPKDAKTCSVFVTNIGAYKRGLSATYPAPILTAFEIKDANRCTHAYTGYKIPNLCAGVLQGFDVQHGRAPEYITDLCIPCQQTTVSCTRQLPSSWHQSQTCRRSFFSSWTSPL